jgi:Mor family transcriptional regulator
MAEHKKTRNQEIYMLWCKRFPITEIAKHYGLSKTRVSEISKKLDRKHMQKLKRTLTISRNFKEANYKTIY